MPKGMIVPVAVGPKGGAAVHEGSQVIGQNVILGLIPAGSLHPFHQNIAPEEDLIFEIRDVLTGGLYVQHAREFFREMEQMGFARLFPGGKGLAIEKSSSREGTEGDMMVTVRYVNLETNRNEKLQFPVLGGER